MTTPVKTSDKSRLALLALAVMAVIWGYNWVVMKRVLAFSGPFDFTALRNVFGALFLMLLIGVRRQPLRLPRAMWPRIALLGLLQTSAFSLLIQLALLQGNAGKSSILTYTMPFWIIALTWMLFGERIRGLQWAALLLAACGLVTILQPWHSQGSLVSEACAVGAGFCWGMAAMVVKWIRRDADLPLLAMTAWQMAFGALALLAAAWIVPEKPIIPAPYFFFALAYNAILATSVAWFLWMFALQHLPAGMAGMASLGVPVVSVLAGWIELGECPTVVEAIGMASIVLALVMTTLAAGRQNGSG